MKYDSNNYPNDWGKKMKMGAKKIAIFGLIILIVGIVGAITSFYVIIDNPSEVAVETLYFDDSDDLPSYFDPIYNSTDLSERISLDKGDYEVWYDAEFLGLGGPRELTIRDSTGNLIYRKSSILGSSDSVSRNGKEYRRYCTFEIEESGDYTLSVEDPTTLYVTPPVNLGLGVGLGFMFVVFGIIGVILMIVGAGLYFFKENKPPKPEQPPPPPQQYPQYPYYPGYSGYPYPPPPDQQPPSPPQPPPQQPVKQASRKTKKSQLKTKTKPHKVTTKPAGKKLKSTPEASAPNAPPPPYPPQESPPYQSPQYPPQQNPYPYYAYPYSYDSYYYYNPYYYPYYNRNYYEGDL